MAATDHYTHHQRSMFDPPGQWKAVALDDDNDLDTLPTCIRCSQDATISVMDTTGRVVAMYFAGGVWHPLRPKRIRSTGTTADTTVWIGWG